MQAIDGKATLRYSMTGQQNFLNNLYTALPLSDEMAIGKIDVQQGNEQNLGITGKTCYQCWYFFVIVLDNPASYRLRLSIT